MGSAKRTPKVATGQTINPTAWQTAALGVEGSAALKRRQQRPMTGPENGAGTGRRARLAWPGLAEELLESPPWRVPPRVSGTAAKRTLTAS